MRIPIFRAPSKIIHSIPFLPLLGRELCFCAKIGPDRELIVKLFCSKCQAIFSDKRSCPQCGDRLIEPSEAHVMPRERMNFVPQEVTTSAASRVLAGTAVTFGLIMGFREIVLGLLTMTGESDQWWKSDSALVAILFVRAVAALGGGLLAGAGRDQYVKSGFLSGLLSAAIFFGMHVFEPGGKVTLDAVIAAGMTILFSTVAGLIGGRIWSPRTELPRATLSANGSSILDKAKDLQEESAANKIRPNQWLRVCLGVSITICGFVGAEAVRTLLVRSGDGIIDLGGSRNLPLTCMQIAGVIAILGGIAAGASTGAGFRHGVFAGLLAGAITSGIFGLRGPEKLPAARGVMEVLDWSPEKTPAIRAMGSIFGSYFVIGSISGLFGGLLFPPVINRAKSRQAGNFRDLSGNNA